MSERRDDREDLPPPTPFAVGERVTWIHTPRGGYGYTWPVEAEIVHVTPKRVRIRVALLSGEMVERTVRPEHLRRRRDRGQPARRP